MDFPTEFAMAAPVRLRTDFDATTLRRPAKAAHHPHQSRRLLALAVIHEGGSRSDAARIADVGLQTVRDWVLRFNAHGPQGLINRKAPGQTPRLNQAQRRALQQVVEQGPIPAVHGVNRAGFSGGDFVWVTPPWPALPAWHSSVPRLPPAACCRSAPTAAGD